MPLTKYFETLMAPNSKVLIVILHLIVFSFQSGLSNSDESDSLCLRSIKESLQDPFNLRSWDFFNNRSQGFICQFSGVYCRNSDHDKVTHIQLPNKGLKGMFPRGLEQCRNLEVLNLSNNELSGPIPSDIDARLPFVKTLVLSNNRFSGEIPPSISDCHLLNDLRLDNNQLTGQIPQDLGLLMQIKTFSVANNQLSGKVPKFINTTVPLEAYENNRGLCGWPLKPCKVQTLIFTKSFKLGFIIGYFVFTLSTITVFMSYCIRWTHLKEAKDVVVATPLLNRKNKEKKAVQDSELATMQLLQIPMLERMLPTMSFTQLSRATDDFRVGNIIGFGKMGIMYKATLPNGRLIAVKRSYRQLINEEFVFELKTLGSFRHVNCIPLLGFCIESTERLLVYKYMSNGNLHDWLHPVQNGAKILEWPLKVKIAIGLARGLAWLHHVCRFRVVHLKLSSKCVLLDQNFEPKLSNFGKAMLMNPNDIGLNRPRGFSINSEFYAWDFIKKDVFDFGIVLLELITGEDPPSKETKGKERFSGNVLAKWICQLSNNKSPIQEGLDCEILHLLEVASNCVQPFPERRPTMLEVYKTLRVVGEKYGVVDVSEIDFR